VVCPLHRYDFDLKTGKGLSGVADTLTTYPIEFREDGVYLGIIEKKSPWWI
jgi:nitrite reductase/ring-hydroxylating ferredoxin subunit